MTEIIETYKATICFTAPTAYRAMLVAMDKGADLSSLRVAVSAGETLPAPVYDEWVSKTGKPIVDGIGSTEMQIGRASCRESVCQYVKISVVAVSLKKKNA